MDIAELTNLSIAGFTLLILFFIVKYFVAAMTLKDQQIKEMTESFSKTINNHIVHEQDAYEAQTKALRSLTVAIKNLSNNNKKK